MYIGWLGNDLLKRISDKYAGLQEYKTLKVMKHLKFIESSTFLLITN